MKHLYIFKTGLIFIISGVFLFLFSNIYEYININIIDIENGKRVEEKVNNLYSTFLANISLYKDNLNKT